MLSKASAWTRRYLLWQRRNRVRFFVRAAFAYASMGISLAILIAAGALNPVPEGQRAAPGQLAALAVAAAGTFAALLVFLLPMLREVSREPVAALSVPPLSSRLASAMQDLEGATNGLLKLMDEAANLARQRERLATEREARVAELDVQASTLRKQVEDLQAMPVGAAEQVVRMLSDTERRGGNRDRTYFLLGVGAAILIQAVATFGFLLLKGS